MRSRLYARLRHGAWSLRGQFEGHALVLMYHRVAEPTADPWALCVSRRNFAEHLAVLRVHASTLTTGELRARLRSSHRGPPLVALTFDDGYADNLHYALPLLQQAAVPATVFVATGWTDGGRAFWWDELADLVLGPGERPARLELELGSKRFSWQRDATPEGEGTRQDERLDLHRVLWNELRQLTDVQIAAAIGQLRAWSGRTSTLDPMARPMTAREVFELHRSGLVEIGAHARTHRSLTGLPPDDLQTEVCGSRRDCERIVGIPPTCFAYPHGDADDATAAAVSAAGFRQAFGSRHGLMWTRSEPYQVPRIVVPDVDGDEFERKLRQEWLA